MDHAVDGGEGQPGPELGPGGSCGVHNWIEGASGDGRRVSWFAPQNQGGGRRSKNVEIKYIDFQRVQNKIEKIYNGLKN